MQQLVLDRITVAVAEDEVCIIENAAPISYAGSTVYTESERTVAYIEDQNETKRRMHRAALGIKTIADLICLGELDATILEEDKPTRIKKLDKHHRGREMLSPCYAFCSVALRVRIA